MVERVPVGVVSYTDAGGMVVPLEIVWGDGRRWKVEVEIDEAWGRRPAQGCGQQARRYRVRILPSGQRKWLFLDWPGWHVEVARKTDGEAAQP